MATTTTRCAGCTLPVEGLAERRADDWAWRAETCERCWRRYNRWINTRRGR